MIAFHNDRQVKRKYLARIRHHIEQDNLIRGQGWNGHKGCAIGCTLEEYDHELYETELGIPEWLARVEDCLFEGMAEKKARTWPVKFLKAIHVGADLEEVKGPFTIVLLESVLESLDKCNFDGLTFPEIQNVLCKSKITVNEIIKLHTLPKNKEKWSAALPAVEAIESAARLASESLSAESQSAAKWSAVSAMYAVSAAVESMGSSPWSVNGSMRSAAESAKRSAGVQSNTSFYLSRARSMAYDHYAEELLKLLKECK